MNTQDLRAELIEVNAKIKKLTPYDSHVDAVGKAFHLGTVGGSGRNNYRLNKRREVYLDRIIDAAVKLAPLYNRRDHLEKLIEDIESGEYQKRVDANKVKKEALIKAKVAYWNSLKPGDLLNIGNSNGNPVITKKNKKSVETGSGCKWTAVEIIGREAASLL